MEMRIMEKIWLIYFQKFSVISGTFIIIIFLFLLLSDLHYTQITFVMELNV
jgi:hypothetical protein